MFSMPLRPLVRSRNERNVSMAVLKNRRRVLRVVKYFGRKGFTPMEIVTELAKRGMKLNYGQVYAAARKEGVIVIKPKSKNAKVLSPEELAKKARIEAKREADGDVSPFEAALKKLREKEIIRGPTPQGIIFPSPKGTQLVEARLDQIEKDFRGVRRIEEGFDATEKSRIDAEIYRAGLSGERTVLAKFNQGRATRDDLPSIWGYLKRRI